MQHDSWELFQESEKERNELYINPYYESHNKH